MTNSIRPFIGTTSIRSYCNFVLSVESLEQDKAGSIKETYADYVSLQRLCHGKDSGQHDLFMPLPAVINASLLLFSLRRRPIFLVKCSIRYLQTRYAGNSNVDDHQQNKCNQKTHEDTCMGQYISGLHK